MASHRYHFITHWRVQATAQEVYQILENATDLPRWWPAVYLQVEEVKPADGETPSVYHLHTKGWLPYRLHWQFYTVEKIPCQKITLMALGDLTGSGVWTLMQSGKWVDIIYDWQIEANKPLLRRFSFLLKPFFSANHHWAMAKGEQSLKLELMRRHAENRQEQMSIAAPPGPSHTFMPLLLLGVAGAGVVLLMVMMKGILPMDIKYRKSHF